MPPPYFGQSPKFSRFLIMRSPLSGKHLSFCILRTPGVTTSGHWTEYILLPVRLITPLKAIIVMILGYGSADYTLVTNMGI